MTLGFLCAVTLFLLPMSATTLHHTASARQKAIAIPFREVLAGSQRPIGHSFLNISFSLVSLAAGVSCHTDNLSVVSAVTGMPSWAAMSLVSCGQLTNGADDSQDELSPIISSRTAKKLVGFPIQSVFKFDQFTVIACRCHMKRQKSSDAECQTDFFNHFFPLRVSKLMAKLAMFP